MYGNPAMTCFKYQVYRYGSEAITYYQSWAHRSYKLSERSKAMSDL
jgi:hypothetical protein